MHSDILGKNIKYLRDRLSLDINQLAEITEIDPIDIYNFEMGNFDLHTNNKALVSISNYAMIWLGDLILEDIATCGLLNNDKVLLLQKEYQEGIEVNRNQFYKMVYENEKISEQIDNATHSNEVKKILANVVHQSLKAQDRYKTLRKRGLIGRNDFFEE